MELVELCGTKIAKSLNKDNVLTFSAFAETCNADKLMKACAMFILNNGPDIAKQNWKDKMQGCPKMMFEIINLALEERVYCDYCDNEIYVYGDYCAKCGSGL